MGKEAKQPAQPPAPRVSRSETFKNIALGISGVLSSILIPLVGFYYAEKQKDKEIDKGFVELGIKILSEDPKPENQPLRAWAISLVNNYSEVKLDETAQQLLEKVPLVTSGGHGLPPQVLDKLQTDGFVLGVGVSHFNSGIDYATLKTRQIKFVYVKATQGIAGIDAAMEINVREASKNGMFVGLYHFFEPATDPVKQAENFAARLKGQEWTLPPVVDCENLGGHSLPKDYADRVYQFIQKLQSLTKEKPIIYAATAFADQNFDNRFSNYPIFISKYITSSTSTAAPIAPKWWKSVTFWHLTDAVSDPLLAHLGIFAFRGSETGLKALLAENKFDQPAN